MAVKYDPLLNKLRIKDNIPQLASDPSSPRAEDAWILATVSAGSGGGKAQAFLGFWLTNPNTGASASYQLSYRTKEGTTKRVTIS